MDRFNKALTSDEVSAGQADKNVRIGKPILNGDGRCWRNEIKIFQKEDLGFRIRTILNADGSISVSAEDTAIGFGWTQEKNGKTYVKWERFNGFCMELGFSPLVGKDDFIPESLFYMLGFKAGNERALKFQQWLAVEVLPSIRKNGGYISGQETMSDDELLAKAFVVAQNKIAERDKAISQLKTEVDVKNQLIGELKPKADYTDLILNNKGLVTITQIAKDYGMSGQEMNELLHGLVVQYKQSGQWLLYKDYHDKGYTHSVTVNFTRSDGRPDIKMDTKWTQKGRLFMYNLLKDNGYLPLIEKESA